MEDGPYRAQRPTGGRRRAYEEDPYEDPQDILARYGLLDSDATAAPPGGRAARRRAAEPLPGTDDERYSVESPSGRHGAPGDGVARSGRRYRNDEPDRPRNGYAAPDEPAPVGRRRAPEPFEAPPAPDAPPTGGRRHRGAPEAAPEAAFPAADGTRRHRPAEPNGIPGAAGRRRRRADDYDDLDEPAPPRRRPVEPSGPAVNPAAAARRRDGFPPTPTEPPPRSDRTRRHVDPFDDAGDDRSRPPAEPQRRRGDDPLEVSRPRGDRRRPADPGSNGGGRRYHPDPVDEPAATTALPAATTRRRRSVDPDAGSPPTTAAPAAGNPRRRRVEPAAALEVPAAATTALPAAPRRRGGEPTAQATTALPTTRRRPPDPPEDAPARSARTRPATEPPATTAQPVDAGHRARAADPPARSRGDAISPDATVAVRRAADGDGDRLADRDDDSRTRALRIDETLTRLTAAHAGVRLAVTDRRLGEPGAPPPRRGPAVIAGRVLAGVMALAVLAATAFGWGTKTWLGSSVRNAAALDRGSSAVVDAAAQAGDQNVLVVATGPPSDTPEARADTVAVAHIPDTGGPVTVLAFPLDLEINRPPCEAWDARTATYRDEPVKAEARTQLVSALDAGGPRCITRVVQQLSGLAITKYVGIDLAAVPAMTDAVGGAEVCVPRPVLDGVLGPVVADPGPTRLAGVRVADFVQAGDVEGEPSPEYGRIERQQQVLAAVLDSAVSGTALVDVGRIRALRPTLANALLTDGAGIDQVLALAMTLRRLDADGVRFVAVPTGERNGRGNAVMRDTDAAALFAAVRGDQPLPANATDPGAGTSGPAPSEVSVTVVNASTRSGLAGEVSETLSSLGFKVSEPSSADQPTSETVIRFSPDQAAAAEVLRATVPSATETPDPGSTGVLQLVLGQSFDDVVRAPSEPIALSAPTSEASPTPAVTCT
ncbi:LCP family protein [Pseudonocardia cypriaca]|uniref:LytR family transcriptional attenuator n=1 Tax=Pseudonocardia cypriaca TaxID=882449 RepID=A0A543FZF9_9PSEU|nr:LCP family protein [Pseudonocardia cypriaca]TQM39185.1 LytR family transcriptional attenuator [Pseudonocardia cypriaca]